MSELTICNYCSLKRIEERAKERGATVTTYEDRVEGTLDYWIAVRVSDKEKPVAYFLQLTTHCAC